MGQSYLIFIEIGVKKTISEFQHSAFITLTMLIISKQMRCNMILRTSKTECLFSQMFLSWSGWKSPISDYVKPRLSQVNVGQNLSATGRNLRFTCHKMTGNFCNILLYIQWYDRSKLAMTGQNLRNDLSDCPVVWK